MRQAVLIILERKRGGIIRLGPLSMCRKRGHGFLSDPSEKQTIFKSINLF